MGSAVWGLGCFQPLAAQVVPDNTLPTGERSQITGNPNFQIDGGATRGGNLFHSFSDFSIPTGGSAFFNNAADVQNILTRVTGGSISNIDGLIRANGTANLFLLNPNGIIFGQNASLNIGGSFVATTANALGFGNLGFFSASNPEAPSALLTINPSALLFNQIAAAPIQNNSTAPAGTTLAGEDASGLRVPNGRSLLLVGGNISMDGGRLNALGGRVELGGLVSAGTVGLNVDGNNLSLSYPNSVERSDIFLSNGVLVNVRASDGGSIALNARNLEMTGESYLYAGIDIGLGSDTSQVGNISVNATGAITLNNGSEIANQVLQEANGQAGDINISASTLRLEGGAQVDATTFGAGKAGSLRVDAQDVQINGSGLYASANRNSTGNAGDLTIKTNTLLVRDGAQIATATFRAGNGGSLRVDAQDVQLIGTRADGAFTTGLFASANRNSTGNAGDLRIETNTMLVQDGAGVTVQSLGTGTAGNMTLNARSIRLDNNALFSANTRSALVDPNREQATININSQALIMTRNSNIRTNATGASVFGGNININADVLVGIDNSDITANSADFRGGNVTINTQGIFGIQFRDVASPQTSDITATGATRELPGNVQIIGPDVDPTTGLVELPTDFVDRSDAIAQGCPASEGNSFVVTGRGGLPPNPEQQLDDDAEWLDRRRLVVAQQTRHPTPDTPTAQIKKTTSRTPIIEASGWQISPTGQVLLVAATPEPTVQHPLNQPVACPGR
jgi:filamentous hemagglutinin family protein